MKFKDYDTGKLVTFKETSHGAGFIDLLAVAFIVLKLCKVIDWPWVWVLSPIWITISLVLIISFIFWLWVKL
jgi:hypothetical protein